MTMRTFIALPVPDEIADHLSRLHQSVPREAGRITWVGADAIHVTCTFLGEVEEDRITPIGAALERVASGIAPYEMSLDGVGAFPGFRRARVVWAGLEKGEEETTAFKLQLDEALEPLGFAAERRPFHPHITLGRVRQPGRTGLLEHAAAEWILPYEHWLCREAVLYRSELTRHGAIYTDLVRAPLLGRTDG